MKRIILFFIFLLLFSSFTYAVAPVTTIFEGETGINVNVNIMDKYEVGENRFSVIHLFNASSGEQMTPLTHPDVICTIHLRNSQGFEITNVNATTHNDHWDLNGSQGNMTPLGDYAWTLSCNDEINNVGGYTSGVYSITENGYEDDKSIFLSLILGIFIFCFLLLYIAFNLEKVHVFLKLIILFVVIFIQNITGKIILNIVVYTIYEPVGLIFYTAILWFIRIFVVYVLIYFIYSILDYMGKIPSIKGWKK